MPLYILYNTRAFSLILFLYFRARFKIDEGMHDEGEEVSFYVDFLFLGKNVSRFSDERIGNEGGNSIHLFVLNISER